MLAAARRPAVLPSTLGTTAPPVPRPDRHEQRDLLAGHDWLARSRHLRDDAPEGHGVAELLVDDRPEERVPELVSAPSMVSSETLGTTVLVGATATSRSTGVPAGTDPLAVGDCVTTPLGSRSRERRHRPPWSPWRAAPARIWLDGDRHGQPGDVRDRAPWLRMRHPRRPAPTRVSEHHGTREDASTGSPEPTAPGPRARSRRSRLRGAAASSRTLQSRSSLTALHPPLVASAPNAPPLG